ncbi:MAG: hypothetical protein ACM30G_21935 [Micromonosporaceae bacterium]
MTSADEPAALHTCLPDPVTLRRRGRALALLDAILCPEWEYRYHSYDARWSPGHEVSSMRTGSGDGYWIVFAPAGVLVLGFAHESPRSPWRHVPPRPWPGLLDGIPGPLQSYLDEVRLDGVPAVTVCAWWDAGQWRGGELTGAPPDGSLDLFTLLLAEPSAPAYGRFAQDYFEVGLDLTAVARVFAREPLTQELVHALSEHVAIEDLAEECATIGWPLEWSKISKGVRAAASH